MSNPESFIEEVNEEVRRDRMSRMLRRWGWAPVLLVVLLVSGASWNEYSKSVRDAEAQSFGDAVLSSLQTDNVAEGRDILLGIEPANERQAAVLALLQATAQGGGEDGDREAATQTLLAAAEAPDIDPIYRDLALMKVMLEGGTGDASRDASILEQLATPGAPYRTLAVEQQALAAVAAGDTGTAITLLRVLSEDAEATESLRRRALQLIVALGASPDPA